MKKLIFLSLFLTLTAVSLGAQTNYYPGGSGTIVRSGYTYKYVSDGGGYISVHNIDTRFFGAKQSQRDGSLIPGDGRIPGFEDDKWTKPRCVSIVREAMNSLSASERSLVEGNELEICLYIDTSTGKVADVVFSFFYFDSFYTSPFSYVPVEVYRKIETDLKSQIWFTLTPHGKALNYAIRSWFQTIKFTSH